MAEYSHDSTEINQVFLFYWQLSRKFFVSLYRVGGDVDGEIRLGHEESP